MPNHLLHLLHVGEQLFLRHAHRLQSQPIEHLLRHSHHCRGCSPLSLCFLLLVVPLVLVLLVLLLLALLRCQLLLHLQAPHLLRQLLVLLGR